MKKAAILILMLTHLLVIASGLIRKSFVTNPHLFEVKKSYQMLTAAGASYGFFSPEIGNQFLIHYEVGTDHEPVSLSHLVSGEVALRIGNMNRFFLYRYEKEDNKRAIAASLTAPMFEHFPQAEDITFISELYFIPTMQDYANGSRPSRKEVYRAHFKLPGSSRAVTSQN